MRRALVVTSCSNRKRIAPSPELRARNLASGPSEAIAKNWHSLLACSESAARASELYCGRSFALARGAADALSAPLYIISAGVGLVHADDLIPPYSLTVAPGSPDNVLAKITSPCSAREWWKACSEQSSNGRQLGRTLESADLSRVLLLMALPGTYLRMIDQELLQLPDAALSRIRIFSGAPPHDFPEPVRSLIMPYDARLDGKDSPAPGTLSDFAARALADFAQWILREFPDANVEEHRAAVARRLQSWAYAASPARERLTDERLIALIRANWTQAGTSASRMLRYFRDEMGIACEHGRFAHLFATVQHEQEMRT